MAGDETKQMSTAFLCNIYILTNHESRAARNILQQYHGLTIVTI